MKTAKDLPVIIEGGTIEFKKQGELKDILNQNPPKAYIEDHPFAKGVKYLPIGRVETLLDVLFQQWRVEIKSITLLAQSICCTVRLHYLNPITNEWSFHDGVGAVPLKTDKGFSAADLAHIKSDAVATGAPAAKAFAIKDAAEELGKLFGRDLNRKNTMSYFNLFESPKQQDDELQTRIDEALAGMRQIQTMPELQSFFIHLPKEIREAETVITAKNIAKDRIIKSNQVKGALNDN